MRKYLILLLISFLSLGLLNCGKSKTKTSKEETRQKQISNQHQITPIQQMKKAGEEEIRI